MTMTGPLPRPSRSAQEGEMRGGETGLNIFWARVLHRQRYTRSSPRTLECIRPASLSRVKSRR